MSRIPNKTESASILRAEKMAERELRLNDSKRKKMPPIITDKDRELLGESFGEVVDDRLAEKLLPQARVVVMMRGARGRFIKNKTYIGQLAKNLDDLYEAMGFLEQDLEEIERGTVAGHGFPASRKELWRRFVKAIRSGDRRRILRATQFLMIEIHSDILRLSEELPPLPPRYRLPK